MVHDLIDWILVLHHFKTLFSNYLVATNLGDGGNQGFSKEKVWSFQIRVIRIRNSKDRHHNSQTKKYYKKKSNGQRNFTEETMHEQHEPH